MGYKGWPKGKSRGLMTLEHKQKIREGNFGKAKPKPDGFKNSGTFAKGCKAWNRGLTKEKSHGYGKPSNSKNYCWTPDQKLKLRGRKVWNKGLTLPPSLNGHIVRVSGKKPNEAEKFVTSLLLQLFGNDYEYVGNFRVWLDGKNPDWINVNGQKKIIEFFGRRWHKPEDEQDRIIRYKKFGYDTLVIWSEELSNMEALKLKLINFNRR